MRLLVICAVLLGGAWVSAVLDRPGFRLGGKREAKATVAENGPVKRMAETCCWTMHGFKCSGCGGKRDVENRPVKREAVLESGTQGCKGFGCGHKREAEEPEPNVAVGRGKGGEFRPASSKRSAEGCPFPGPVHGCPDGKREAVAAVEESPVKREAVGFTPPPFCQGGFCGHRKREAEAAVVDSPVKRMAETCCWTMHGFKCSGCGGKRAAKMVLP